MDVMKTRQVRGLSLTKVEQIKEICLYIIIIGLVIMVVKFGFTIRALMGPQLVRSQAEVVVAGKRWIELFFSLNSATVEYDQDKAISLIVDPERQAREAQKLLEDDLIRTVQKAAMTSRIDWSSGKSEVVGLDGDRVQVRYQAQLVRNGLSGVPLDMIVTLTPVEKDDTFTDGVGIVDWTDIAENPFVETPENEE